MMQEFDFATGSGVDTVTGFQLGTDLLVFHVADLTQFTDLTISGNASQTQVDFGTGTIFLLGVDIASFSASDVVFL